MEIIYEIRKSNRRSISAKIGDDGKILVKAPIGTPESVVVDFLNSKKAWIMRQYEKTQQQNLTAQQMGLLSDDEIAKIKKLARKLIPERVEYYAKLSGISYNRIFIRLQKSRWGSCSTEGNLNFNCLLVLMPLEILDSVVIHELCHRRHMNHSKEFYAEINKYFPNYKACDKWLKKNGGIYLKRVK